MSIKKTGYFKTCKPRSKVPDTMLRCVYCGALNTDLEMTIVESEKSSSGRLFRKAHHKECAADYKRLRRTKNKQADILNDEMDFISLKPEPNPLHEIYLRLID